MATRDLYAVLGVMPDVEMDVIPAVYRALAKIYHPDVFAGGKAEAERKMREINAAFEGLGDPKRRAAYDNERAASQRGAQQDEMAESDEARSDPEIDEMWKIATGVYPDVGDRHDELAKLSPTLARTFKLVMLELKKWERADDLAEKLRKEFLRRYFGDNSEIQEFAATLIRRGDREVARHLNKVIKVVGTPADADKIIRRICREHQVTYGFYRPAPTYTMPEQVTPEPADARSRMHLAWVIVTGIVAFGTLLILGGRGSP